MEDLLLIERCFKLRFANMYRVQRTVQYCTSVYACRYIIYTIKAVWGSQMLVSSKTVFVSEKKAMVHDATRTNINQPLLNKSKPTGSFVLTSCSIQSPAITRVGHF